MDVTLRQQLKVRLTKDEGRKNFPYVDTVGKVTIGIGYNLTDRGMPDEWIDTQFNSDVDYFYAELSKLPYFLELNDVRQLVLVDMAFMGMKKLLGFTDMFHAIEKKDYATAAHELLDSVYAQQVGHRAIELAAMMRTGVMQ